MKPNLFIVGAPRAGTTTLYRALADHPNIYMSPVKEPWYHALGRKPLGKDFPFPTTWVQTQKAYDALFADAGAAEWRGEASTLYLASADACQRLAKYDDARIIIVLREPVERGYSNFYQHIRDGRETTTDYAQALADAPARMKSRWLPFYDYQRMGTYHDDVKRYLDAFGRTRVHVVLYDELSASPRETLAAVWQFLGVPAAPIHVGKHNVGGAEKQRHWSTRIIRSEGLGKRVARAIIPAQTKERLFLWLRERSVKKPPIPHDLAKRLHAEARADIVATSALIDRPLDAWLKP